MNFDYFQIQKPMMRQAVRVQKVDEKKGVVCLVCMLTAVFVLLKLLKSVFLKFYADFTKRSKSFVTIWRHASSNSHFNILRKWYG